MDEWLLLWLLLLLLVVFIPITYAVIKSEEYEGKTSTEKYPTEEQEEFQELPWWAALLIVIGLAAIAYSLLKEREKEKAEDEDNE